MKFSRGSVFPGDRRVSVVDVPRNSRMPSTASESAPDAIPPSRPSRNKSFNRPSRPNQAGQSSDGRTRDQGAKTKAPRKARRWLPSGVATRWLGRLSLLTGIIVVVSASVAVAWGLRRYLRTSPRFAVRDVQVHGHQRRTPQQIAKGAGLVKGINIFTINEEVARAAAEADPWVETAKVHVELPNVVSITVTEREARAVAVVDAQLYLADTKGNIFKELGKTDPRDLPVVTGIETERLKRDRPAVTAHIRRALELVSDLEEAKIARRYPIQELHLESDGAVTVTIGTAGVMLVFGKPPFRAKVDKAQRILEELRYRKVKRAVLFLDNQAHPERVVVRLDSMAKKQ